MIDKNTNLRHNYCLFYVSSVLGDHLEVTVVYQRLQTLFSYVFDERNLISASFFFIFWLKNVNVTSTADLSPQQYQINTALHYQTFFSPSPTYFSSSIPPP